MEGLWEKRGGAFYPVDEPAWSFATKLKNHTRFVADCKDPTRRSGRQHRFWFALVGILFFNQDYYTSFEDFRAALLIRLGRCEWHKFKDGTEFPIAHSLKFGKMPQDEFNELVQATLDFAEQMGFDRDELLEQTEEACNARREAA